MGYICITKRIYLIHWLIVIFQNIILKYRIIKNYFLFFLNIRLLPTYSAVAVIDIYNVAFIYHRKDKDYNKLCLRVVRSIVRYIVYTFCILNILPTLCIVSCTLVLCVSNLYLATTCCYCAMC